MATLTSSIRLALAASLTSTLDLGSASAPTVKDYAVSLANGTGANQADLIYADTNTLSASGTANLDLASTLTNGLGATQVFARVKVVLVAAASGNTNDVQVTRPSSNGVPLFMAASDGIAVRPGGLFLWVAPDATGVVVTAGTGDLLTFTNSAGTTGVTYDVVVIGASA